ncbi:hypothetical protein ACOSP7_030019 [Xanthoceras sorbifolium]
MPIGEVFLSAFLQVLFDRLAPHNLASKMEEESVEDRSFSGGRRRQATGG